MPDNPAARRQNAFTGPLLGEPEGSRRSEYRVRVLKQARVVLSTWTTLDCEIRNVSRGGARLEFGAPVALPETFKLMTVSTRMIVPVARVWQRGLSAGVRFVGDVEKAEVSRMFAYAISERTP